MSIEAITGYVNSFDDEIIHQHSVSNYDLTALKSLCIESASQYQYDKEGYKRINSKIIETIYDLSPI